MSLINQMLRDLESRQGDGHPNEPLVLSNVAAPMGRDPAPRSGLKWLMVLVFLMLLAVAGYLAWGRLQPAPLPDTASAPVAAPAPAPAALAPERVVVIPKPAPVVVVARPTPPVEASRVIAVQATPPVQAQTDQPMVSQPAPTQQLEERLQAWAKAWSERDVTAYLDFYSQHFVPANGQSRTAWEAQRRERLSEPAMIQLHLSAIKVVALAPDRAQVAFTQHYQSPSYQDVTGKQLDFLLEAGQWRISAEQVLTERSAAPAQAVTVDEPEATGKIERRLRPLDNAQQAQQQYQQGMQKMHLGKGRQAEEHFQRALKLDARHEQAREAWVGIMLQGGRVVEAGQLLAEGLQAIPGQSQFSLLAARIRMQQGDLAGAAEVLEASARERSQTGDYWALLGVIYQRMQRYNASTEAYRKALNQDPTRAVWWMGQGISLEGAGLKAQAIESYTKAEQTQGLSLELRRYVRQRLEQLGVAKPGN